MSASTILSALALLAGVQHLAFAQNPTLSSSLSAECVSLISVNPPTVSLYASEICRVCQSLQISPSIEPCCAAANPTACFASSFYHISLPSPSLTPRPTPPAISASPTQPGDSSSTNCDSVISIFENCKASTPSFENLCFHDQQSCLCSTSGVWAPSFYDNYWSLCLAWASTASPAEYSVLGPGTNGVVQSRKCQTWAQFTATGGIPSDCLTSPAATLSSVPLASGRPVSIGHSGAAVEVVDRLSSNFIFFVVVILINIRPM